MRKRIFIVATSLAAFAFAGLVSNLVSRRPVERAIVGFNHEAISAIDRLWRIPPRSVKAVQRGAIYYRSDTVDSKTIRYQLPPSTALPFQYAHASSFAPFVLRVRYGWADGGTRMAFGEGGEYVVASLFGSRPVVLSKKPHWYF